MAGHGYQHLSNCNSSCVACLMTTAPCCPGRTPLHYAAMHGRLGAIEELVHLGASLKEKDVRGGYTPLHLAADAGQCEAIVRLVELGASVETPSNKGLSPLALALMKVGTSVCTRQSDVLWTSPSRFQLADASRAGAVEPGIQPTN